MAEWSYKIIDHFGYDREVVALLMSFLERYLSSCLTKMVVSTRYIQVLAIITLFLACKLHCNENDYCSRPQQGPMGASTLSKLSQGKFVTGNVEAMGILILSHMGWRVQPPHCSRLCETPLSPHSMGRMYAPREGEISRKSKFMVELSVMHRYFFGYQRLAISLIYIKISFNLLDERRLMLVHSAYSDTGLKPNTEEITECTDNLVKISTANEK